MRPGSRLVDDLGRIWREADYEATDFETVVTDLLAGQYKNPVGIFGFNAAEGWSRDVTADVAAELRRCDLQLRDVPSDLQDFVDRHDAVDRSRLSLCFPSDRSARSCDEQDRSLPKCGKKNPPDPDQRADGAEMYAV
jgi:hypothetical protein